MNDKHKKSLILIKLNILLVPEAGIEPARYRYRWILSPVRLPVSPLGQRANYKLVELSFATLLALISRCLATWPLIINTKKCVAMAVTI